jgi:hypothetical protein
MRVSMKPARDLCAPGSETLALQSWLEDGGPAWAINALHDKRESINGGSMVGGDRAPVGGLVVVTGHGEERLGYLAALLSESLPEALWIPPPAGDEGEQERRLALSHLASGTSVVQVAATDRQVRQFKDLAERAGARFLLVQATPPPASGESARLPAALEEDRRHWPCVFVQARSSLTTQLEKVLAAWNQLGTAP